MRWLFWILVGAGIMLFLKYVVFGLDAWNNALHPGLIPAPNQQPYLQPFFGLFSDNMPTPPVIADNSNAANASFAVQPIDMAGPQQSAGSSPVNIMPVTRPIPGVRLPTAVPIVRPITVPAQARTVRTMAPSPIPAHIWRLQ